MEKCRNFRTCVCIIWTMDSGFCMFISFVMDKVFTKQVANKWHWFNCWTVVRVLNFFSFVFLFLVWGGKKVLSTNVLHNLYQKKERGGLKLVARVNIQYVGKKGAFKMGRLLRTALPLYCVPEYKWYTSDPDVLNKMLILDLVAGLPFFSTLAVLII